MTDDTGAVDDALAAMARAQQAHLDRERAAFEHAIHTVVPEPDKLHKIMLMNLTTKPRYRPLLLALSWMRADPCEWPGWHPERAMSVAEVNNLGEEI